MDSWTMEELAGDTRMERMHRQYNTDSFQLPVTAAKRSATFHLARHANRSLVCVHEFFPVTQAEKSFSGLFHFSLVIIHIGHIKLKCMLLQAQAQIHTNFSER